MAERLKITGIEAQIGAGFDGHDMVNVIGAGAASDDLTGRIEPLMARRQLGPFVIIWAWAGPLVWACAWTHSIGSVAPGYPLKF